MEKDMCVCVREMKKDLCVCVREMKKNVCVGKMKKEMCVWERLVGGLKDAKLSVKPLGDQIEAGRGAN